MSTSSEKKIAENRLFPLPDYTCSIIDSTVASLEQIRAANEQLREAAEGYARRNDVLSKQSEAMKAQAVAATQLADSRALDRDFLDKIASGTISLNAIEVIEKLAQIESLLTVENVLHEILRVRPLSNDIKRRLSPASIEWLKTTLSKRREKQRLLREAALAKLSDIEKRELGLKHFDADEEEDEDEAL